MFLIVILLFLLPPAAPAADGQGPHRIDGLVLYVEPRTPEQVLAFYAARGLPPVAAERLAQACLFTIGVRNERRDVVWLELDNWRFIDEASGAPVRRIPRGEWGTLWEKLGVPPAGRATFGWTQLPERRDLQPGEPVGGNLALAPTPHALTLEARFRVADSEREIRARIPGLHCAGREEATR